MYRCYLLRNGRIGMRDDTDVATLDEASRRCRTLLLTQAQGDNFRGFEIWCGTSLIVGDAGDGAECAPVPISARTPGPGPS